MDRAKLGWVARGVALTGVFAMSVVAFRSGVDVSDRPGLPEAELLTQLYYAAGLFVLGGLDLGTPVAGPALERGMLWAIYFLAPLITTSAVVEGALRLVGSHALDRVGLGHHLLVVGLGRLGMAFVAAVRQTDRLRTVVALDRDVNRAGLAQVRRQHRVRMIAGDARIASTFEPLALERALGVALLTEDDLLNLDTAVRLAREYPELRIVAHVANISLQRAAAEVQQELGEARLHVINAHRVTAEHLYQNHLEQYFRVTRGKDAVVLAGFGRLGQTIFELLDRRAQTEIATLVIADRAAALRWRTFQAEVGTAALPSPCTVDGDLSDPETWSAIQRHLGTLTEHPVVIAGSDDDGVNLQIALAARRCWLDAKVFVRFQNASPFAERMAERHGFVVLAVEGMLVQALAEAQRAWFVADE